MLSTAKHPHCSEMYAIEKTIEVELNLDVEGPSTLRIEALRDLEGDGNFSTSTYILASVAAQPAPIKVWAHYDLPWTDSRSADEALNHALSALEERCKREAS